MDVDDSSTAQLSALDDASSHQDKPMDVEVESVTVEGETIRVHRPPQPAGTLALPGEYRDGVFHLVYYNIQSMKRTELLNLCKSFALGSTGNMTQFRGKLTGFSENMTRWKSLIPGAKRAHRGVRDGHISKVKLSKQDPNNDEVKTKKTKKLKLSAQRRNELMGVPSDGSVTHLYAAQRSKDTRTVEQKKALKAWATNYYNSHPYVAPEELARMLKTEADSSSNVATPAALSEYMRSTQEQLAGLTSVVGVLVQRISGDSTHTASSPEQLHHSSPMASLVPLTVPDLGPRAQLVPSNLGNITNHVSEELNSTPLPPRTCNPHISTSDQDMSEATVLSITRTFSSATATGAGVTDI